MNPANQSPSEVPTMDNSEVSNDAQHRLVSKKCKETIEVQTGVIYPQPKHDG